jgi:hypothetical protein
MHVSIATYASQVRTKPVTRGQFLNGFFEPTGKNRAKAKYFPSLKVSAYPSFKKLSSEER